MRELVVDGKRIHDEGECYVIAEIGNNHQGSVEKARELIRVAQECGADAVKLQKRDNRSLMTRALYDAPYDNEHSFGPTYGEHREALELGLAEWIELRDYAREIGITFFASAWDLASIDFLAELGVPALKTPSAALLDTRLLRHFAEIGKPVFLSTGGGSMDDVARAVETVAELNGELCVMQCTTSYPADPDELNLRVIETLRERFPEHVIGFSDHFNGISMAPVAYMLGARVVEKHLTLNHTWKGTDHAASLEPIGMRKLVRDLRRVPLALGDGVKRPMPSEARPLAKLGKKIVAARDLEAGHVLEASDLEAKSPADGGLPPYEIDRLVGRRLGRALRFEEDVRFEDLEPETEPASGAAMREQA
jgi:sialic acid synthase